MTVWREIPQRRSPAPRSLGYAMWESFCRECLHKIPSVPSRFDMYGNLTIYMWMCRNLALHDDDGWITDSWMNLFWTMKFSCQHHCVQRCTVHGMADSARSSQDCSHLSKSMPCAASRRAPDVALTSPRQISSCGHKGRSDRCHVLSHLSIESPTLWLSIWHQARRGSATTQTRFPSYIYV